MTIIIKPIEGNLTNDQDNFGKMDPYVVIVIGQEKKRSKTHKGGGKKPRWTDTFQFQSKDQLMKVSVWDDDTINDDLVGEGTVNLNQLYSQPNRTENQYVDLIYHGKSAGRVLLSMQYQGPPIGGNQGYGNQQGWGNQQGNWNGPPQNSGWGGNQGNWNGPPQNSGWGQGPNGPPPGWGGNQGNWNGPPQNSGWGQGPNNNQWGQGPNNNQWGQGPNNNGWGQGPNSGW